MKGGFSERKERERHVKSVDAAEGHRLGNRQEGRFNSETKRAVLWACAIRGWIALSSRSENGGRGGEGETSRDISAMK